MFSKVDVNGPNTHEIYKYLKSNCKEFNKDSNIESNSVDISWNFAKFLVDSEGNVVSYFEPDIEPNSMIESIEKML